MSFFNMVKFGKRSMHCMLILLLAVCLAGPASAKDTDIYRVNVKQNAYILMDDSGSMRYPVYDYWANYATLYDYFFSLNETDPDCTVNGSCNSYIYDLEFDNTKFNNHFDRDRIYLIQADARLTTRTIDSEIVTFTGNLVSVLFTDLDYGSITDTNMLIDGDGNITYDGTGTQRITEETSGEIYMDGAPLPLGQDINLHEYETLHDGSQMDKGFGGLLQAPGYYFSGYEGVTLGGLDPAESGDIDIYFFVTGNWITQQLISRHLYYETGDPDPPGGVSGEWVWPFEEYSSTGIGWSYLGYNLAYPASGNYADDLLVQDTEAPIVHPGAQKIQLHFSSFDVEGDGDVATFNNDYVVLYDENGDEVAKYDNDNNPADGWSVEVAGDTIRVALHSNSSTTGTGYAVNQIKFAYGDGNSYLMLSRMDSAKRAAEYAVNEFYGRLNWGYATFNGSSGATINHALDPDQTDEQNRTAVLTEIQNTSAGGGTPLGEALQDVFEDGYFAHRNSLDNLTCRRNYVISMSDGYPSGDGSWGRIAGVTFQDWDGDGWTADPVQSTDANYYDDVAHWMYTHSIYNKLPVDPATSYENVITYHVAFGGEQALMEDAAGESGGEYIVAYNAQQLAAAFYSVVIQLTDALAFTSPVVSVDAANKIQNGDDLYLGLFLPQDSQGWVGNIKKFKLGDGNVRPNIWMYYDGDNDEAIDSTGAFLDDTAAFWADDNDANDSDGSGHLDVKEDGVGEVLTERVQANFAAATNYYERPIYTSISGGSMLAVNPTNIVPADLNVADDATRDKVVNYVHGYTFDADVSTGAPSAARDWALGGIVHSRPVVVDYYDPNSPDSILKRYIVVGANDGMLHVFDDEDGREIFAFIPEEILPKLRLLPTNPLVETVDGKITLYRKDAIVGGNTVNQPKYLIFGLGRGGGNYFCLNIADSDPTTWALQWTYSNTEITQSWSQPQVASLPVVLNTVDGKVTFKDVVIFSGGYDPVEDNYPEPFVDANGDGTPYDSAGVIDTNEWDANDINYDINDNDAYDRWNPSGDSYGRGIFAVDIDDPTDVTTGILPFSVTHGASDVTTGNAQTLTGMTYAFPAKPAVIATSFDYIYEDAGTQQGRKGNVLKFLYATDIYSNIYKVDYHFDIEVSGGAYSLTKSGWQVSKIFSGNPGSSSDSGTFNAGFDNTDAGRKTFFSPAVSWGGSGDYFDAGNFGFTDTVFDGQFDIATLYMGTGDREHPSYTMIRNRIYAVYDDIAVSGETNLGAAVTVTSAPYTENDLLNLSCDELDGGTTLSGGITKGGLRASLTDDATYFQLSGAEALEQGAGNENDAKGWYVVLEDQGDALECAHCSYLTTVTGGTLAARDNHDGEKVLSEIGLYAGVIYFTSYQPSANDPCYPQGNGFAYSMNYDDATAAYDLNGGDDVYDVTDRYWKINAIQGIPSGFSIITRMGQAGAMAMMGGRVIGPRPPGSGDPGFRIKSPGPGLEIYYWREGNSQE